MDQKLSPKYERPSYYEHNDSPNRNRGIPPPPRIILFIGLLLNSRGKERPPNGNTRIDDADETFLKNPNLISYADSKCLTEISSLFIHEAQMCERLRISPHPNVAKYFGCHVDQHGLITGLCFKRYQKTIHQMAKGREVFDHPKCLSDIRAGIEHLHSLGIIHCDINLHNVMLDGATFVITDFDSCTLEGDELGAKAGTDGWTNDDFELARPENDWFGLEKIKDFLSRVKKPKSGSKTKQLS